MFPQITHLLHYITGFWIPVPGNTFGLFVALAFMSAFWALKSEMLRREKAGEFRLDRVRVQTFAPVDLNEVFSTALMWGLAGWKLGYGIFNWTEFSCDAGGVLGSSKGNIYIGIAAAVIAGALRYRDYLRTKGQEAKYEEQMLGPSRYLGRVLGMAFIAGILGAKIFAFFEDWDGFMADPMGSITSLNGLTFYGGLITAGAVILIFLYRKKYNLFQMLDVFTPGLILAYGVGRLGCQLSGDGDWGILNSAYVVSAEHKTVPAGPGEFEKILNDNNSYYLYAFSPIRSVSEVPHTSFTGFGFMPDWFFAYSYPNNVINEGIPMKECEATPCGEGTYCSRLPLPVFPTPIYETIICILIFIFLWSIRKKLHVHGQLAGIYFFLNGLERFSIEKIRVNTTIHFLGMDVTQAEIISSILMIGGIVMITVVSLRRKE